MTFAKNVALAVVAAVFAYFMASFFGFIYDFVLGIPRTFGIASFVSGPDIEKFFAGIIPAYILFITFLFMSFGFGKKHWWIGVLLLPAVAFVIYFDLSHFWFYILVGLAGWLAGLGIAKILPFLKKESA